MKERLIAAALLQLMTLLAGSKLIKEILELVRAWANVDNLRGTEKKQRVTEELNDVTNEIYSIVENMASWVVSMAIDIAYAYVVTRK